MQIKTSLWRWQLFYTLPDRCFKFFDLGLDSLNAARDELLFKPVENHCFSNLFLTVEFALQLPFQNIKPVQ